jgi:hypothetical protein
MARRPGRPKVSDRDDVSVKIDRALAMKADRIADHRGQSRAAVLSELLRGPVNKAFLEINRELEKGGD